MTQESKTNVIGWVFRILVGLIGLFFLVLGLGFVVLPDIFATAFSVQPAYVTGLNAIRGDFGGLFLGMSFFCILGAATGRYLWFVIPIIFLILIIIGRLISLRLDGFSAAGAQSLKIEAVMVIILAASTIVFARMAGRGERGMGIKDILKAKVLIGVFIVAAILGGLVLSQKKIVLALMNGIAMKAMAADTIADLPDGLHVALCGSGPPLADPRRASACTAVIAGKSLYVVDTGPGSERKLELMRFNPGKIRAVLLTHFHSDHIGDLGELMLKRWAGSAAKMPVDVFGPSGVETVVKGFNQAYALDDEYRILHHGPEVVPPTGAGGMARPFNFPPGKKETVIIDAEGLKVTAFEVNHAPVKPAVGYRFDYKGRSVAISGDTAPVQSLIDHAQGADLLMQEALQPAMIRMLKDVSQQIGRFNTAKIMGDIIGYHTSPEDAAKMAESAGVKHLLLTHITPPLPVSDLKAAFLGDAAQYFHGPITIGEDGMLFSLPAGNKKILMKWLL